MHSHLLDLDAAAGHDGNLSGQVVEPSLHVGRYVILVETALRSIAEHEVVTHAVITAHHDEAP